MKHLKLEFQILCITVLCVFINIGSFAAHKLANDEHNFVEVLLCKGNAYWAGDARPPFLLCKSRFDFSARGKIMTSSDGQVVCNYNNLGQVRLKEDSNVKTSFPNCFNVTKGIVGFNTHALSKLALITSHMEVKVYENSIIIVKVNPIITRICVVKGKALVVKNNKIILVNSGCEIAASKKQLSKIYKHTNELRYTWYWTEPDKEPSYN